LAPIDLFDSITCGGPTTDPFFINHSHTTPLYPNYEIGRQVSAPPPNAQVIVFGTHRLSSARFENTVFNFCALPKMFTQDFRSITFHSKSLFKSEINQNLPEFNFDSN
jgi:hypothetical protein